MHSLVRGTRGELKHLSTHRKRKKPTERPWKDRQNNRSTNNCRPSTQSSSTKNESEKKLAEAVKKVATAFEQADLEEKFNQLASLKEPITDYFDSTMIMAKDEDVKQNRLLQLKQIADLTKDFGKLDNLNVK